jgi:PAS domain S-box-containing protein
MFPLEDDVDSDFGTTLRRLMTRHRYVVTPGWLSKTSGIPKATIVNWLEGRVRRPRNQEALDALSDALRLDRLEAQALFRAAGLTTPPRHPAPFFDAVPVGLYATTPEGRILHANTTLVHLLGYRSLREYCRLDVARDLYVHAEQRSTWLEKMRVRGTLRKEIVWAKRADGSRLLVLDSANAIRDRAGNVVRYEGVWEVASAPRRT